MRLTLLALMLFVSLHTSPLPAASPSICVVIPSYNNEPWCIENLESVACQTYKHFRAVYINDCSSDKTGSLVDSYIASHNLRKKFTVIHNKERRGALYNFYHAITKCDPNEIIVVLDGDDRLIDSSVLSYIAKLYEKNPALWLTYGSLISKPIPRRSVCREFPRHINKRRDYRHFPFVSSHLRTFYAGLFQEIKKSDLMENGQFLASAGDVATMLPMLEMAGPEHFKYVRRVLYVYRDNNPLNDFNNRPEQKRCSLLIRSRPPYKQLNRAVWRD